MLTLLALVVVLVAPLSLCSAETVRGFLSMDTRSVETIFRLRLLLADGKTTPPLPVRTSVPVRETLLGLSAGDFVIASGEALDEDGNGRPDLVRVDAIDSVGLAQILGLWKSPSWQIVDIRDFNRIHLYDPEPGPSASAPPPRFRQTRTLRYSLRPDRNGEYSVFIIEDTLPSPKHLTPVRVGTLRVFNQGTSLEIHIFDPRTGARLETISLTAMELVPALEGPP